MSDSGEFSDSSPEMDRNPSPPPESEEAESAGEDAVDAIGATVYSKHWLFSTLTKLIQTVTEQNSADTQDPAELSEEQEDELCKVWDMAMDQDVSGFLQEFKAPDILLGVIAKSQCPRLTEICVGILGNMACFHDTCLDLSQNEDLGAVLLLLLGDADPPTLLETCRLLLTCMSQADVAPLWLERFHQQPSLCPSLLFIMSSSTNVDLLVKVGQLVDKLFDEDEGLMGSWLCGAHGGASRSHHGGGGGDSSGDNHHNEDEDDDGSGDEPRPDVPTSLLEAAKQLRSESCEGLEVYLHAIQLLTTVDEGIQALVCEQGAGAAVWAFLCAVVCEDLCQPDEPALCLQEQKSLLGPALATLSALHACQGPHFTVNTDVSLVGSVLRILQYHRDMQQISQQEAQSHPGGQPSSQEGGDEGKGEDRPRRGEDEQLTALLECTCELLASILAGISRDEVNELVKRGLLTEKTCSCAAQDLLPQHTAAVEHLASVLADVEPKLAESLKSSSKQAQS
ncbi:protein saal1 [Engraulis encrasicolus]|uniref:protein saal1 n=1 Tax=Engraulis encrasicolus TaxID=184585 RepID=UPI002FD06194